LQDARTPTYANATDNAIAAVGKILRYHPNVIDCSKSFPVWLSMLPVVSDVIESLTTYALLCDFLESSNPHLLGPQFQNLPKILSILARILQTNLINEEISNRIVNILKKMRTSFQPELLQSVWTSLSEEHRMKLQGYFA